MLLEPVGEALVQLGARRLRQRLVGGVADQQVAEAEGVLAGNCGLSGRTSSLRTSDGQARRTVCSSSGASACTAPRWKTLALDRAALEHGALGGSSWSRRAASSAWIVGGTVDVAVARLLDERDHLLDEQRVALGGLADPVRRPSSSCAEARDQQLRLVGPSGSSSTVVAFTLPPAQPGRRSSSSGRAMQSSRIGASRERSATCSTRSRNVSSAPVDVVEDADQRPLGGAASSSLRKAQAISSARGRQLARRRGATRIACSRCSGPADAGSCLSDLDHRPVGDALAVGQAAAADDERVEPSEELGHQARLADAGRPEDREQLAGAVRAPPGRRRRAGGAARVSRPTIGVSACRRTSLPRRCTETRR